MWKLMGTVPAEGVESTVIWLTTSTRVKAHSSEISRRKQMKALPTETAEEEHSTQHADGLFSAWRVEKRRAEPLPEHAGRSQLTDASHDCPLLDVVRRLDIEIKSSEHIHPYALQVNWRKRSEGQVGGGQRLESRGVKEGSRGFSLLGILTR